MVWRGWRQAALLLLISELSQCYASKLLWTHSQKLVFRDQTRDLWNHGFNAYMKHGFPKDEIRPLTCQGQGPDFLDPANFGVNDVMGNYSLTLIDSLSSLVVLRNYPGFNKAVRDVVLNVPGFDIDVRPQVFEVTIRVLGGLLSAHIFASEEAHGFKLDWYRGELLTLAEDLGKRLLKAFATPTGIPYARVNLRSGVLRDESQETCAAGAASLVMEFATLSRLTSNTVYELAARKAFYAIWNRRSDIGLVGNTVNVATGAWTLPLASGIGAGIDSFYEYALKSYILLGEPDFLDVWHESYAAVMKHIRGREGFWFRNAWMDSGIIASVQVDSLSAFWPGLQVLGGDVQNAIKSHLVYWNIWRRYGGMPERFNIITKQADLRYYPLRPEFIESTYFLYRATKDPFYLDVGLRILRDFQHRYKVPCGLAGMTNIENGERSDRMESFVLSETLMYLFLLFDEHHPFHGSNTAAFVFTTEGHPLVLPTSVVKSASPARRALREAEQLSCPPYLPPLIGVDPDDPEGWGIVGGVKDRSDVEIPRHLVGGGATGKEWWDREGWCELPKVEEYSFDFILSKDGRPTPEDLSPSSKKLKKIAAGFVLNDITGIRAHIVRRLDERGYDVTKLGPHRVLTGQIVYINDSKILLPASATLKRSDVSRLHFTHHTPGDSIDEWEADAWPATFGGSVSAMSGDVRVSVPEDDWGCKPAETPVPAGKTIVWLVWRGGCNFVDKLQRAKDAGARGVIVMNDASEHVTAALGDDEKWEAEADDAWLALVDVKAGQKIWSNRRPGELRVRVVAEEREKVPPEIRHLHVDGKPLLNTILMG